jgi:hypothetical protein
MNAKLAEARAAKAEAAKVFRELVGEVAVGIMKVGKDQFGIKVNLPKSPAADVKFPTRINGLPVTVEVVGQVRKR